MGRTTSSFTIEGDIVERLEKFAKYKRSSKSRIVENLLDDNLPRINEILKRGEFTEEQLKNGYTNERHVQTEEERLADWEWRKKQVAEGKFPIHMGEEYPREKENQINEFIKPLEKPAKKSQEDIDFDKSIADSMAEKK